MEQVRAAAVEAYAQRGSCLDEHEFGRLVTYAVAQVRDTPEEGLYGAWQSEDWTQAEPDEDEAQIEKLVAKELQRIEVNRPGFDGGSCYWISTSGWSVRFVA